MTARLDAHLRGRFLPLYGWRTTFGRTRRIKTYLACAIVQRGAASMSFIRCSRERRRHHDVARHLTIFQHFSISPHRGITTVTA